jgi:hypothetical protein
MAMAQLYPRPKSAMQSGKRNVGRWVLRFVSTDAQRPDPLTGWIGGAETQAQVTLEFPSEAAALAYARANGLTVETVPPAPHTLKIRAYADNFR